MRLDPPVGFRGVFREDPEARAVYSEAAGIARNIPRAVAVPQTEDDVSLLIRWARARGMSVVPRGSGSSMGGGAIGEGVILDLSRLRHLGDPDEHARSLRAGVGVLRGELDRHAASVGLRFPVDPSSGEFCTIGGMASTNAAGPRSLLHGAMRPWVRSLDCIFDDGSRATVRRGDRPPDVAAINRFMADTHAALIQAGAGTSHAKVLKDSSGYAISAYARTRDLVDLLVGSEGTLAVFTAVEVGLIPVAPAQSSLLVSFRDLDTAVEAALAARTAQAAACELLDGTFLRIAATAGRPIPVSAEADAVLMIGIEAENQQESDAGAARLMRLLRSLGALDAIATAEPATAAELWSLRHAASPAIARMDPRLRSMQFIEDAAVPPGALAEYVRGVRSILERSNTAGVIFGHAGDCHVHVNPLIDVGDPRWRDLVERILTDVTALVARLGGTLTGEHGDGRLRTPLMDRVWSAEEVERFARVKHSFDPSALFNPGVKVPLKGQMAVDVVKYDPTLTELPVAARRALQAVERDRAYATPRLDLLAQSL